MVWSFNKETVAGLFRGQIQKDFGVSVEVVVFWGHSRAGPSPCSCRAVLRGCVHKRLPPEQCLQGGAPWWYCRTRCHFVLKVIRVGDF